MSVTTVAPIMMITSPRRRRSQPTRMRVISGRMSPSAPRISATPRPQETIGSGPPAASPKAQDELRDPGKEGKARQQPLVIQAYVSLVFILLLTLLSNEEGRNRHECG